jgi:hypothetical protein
VQYVARDQAIDVSLEEKQKELSSLLDLPHNWNGYGDKEIDRAIVAQAHQFLLMICDLELPNIFPLHDGGLFMTWGDDERLIVSFLPEKTLMSLTGGRRHIDSRVEIEWEENDEGKLLSLSPSDDFAHINPIRQLIKRLDELQ